MKTEHTPGPWEMAMTDQFEQCYDIFESKTARTLARTVLNLSIKDQEANARLIAAAPELLEACEKAFEQLQRFSAAPNTDQVQSHFDHESVFATDLLRAIIARAKGQL